MLYLLVGTFTYGESEGLYLYRFNPETGDTEYVGCAVADNPSYLATLTGSGLIYSVSEDDKASVAVSLKLDTVNETLKILNDRPTKGSGPTNIAVSPNGKLVATANSRCFRR